MVRGLLALSKDCKQNNVVAGEFVGCNVLAYDKFGNRISREHLATYSPSLSIVSTTALVSTVGTTNNTGIALRSPGVALLTEIGSFYDYTISSSLLNKAGVWKLHVELAATTIGESQKHAVTVSSGLPYLDLSTLTCDTGVPYLAVGTCLIQMSDSFGNAVIPVTKMISSFQSIIQPKEQYVLSIDTESNAFNLKFRPVTLTDKLKISIYFAGFETATNQLGQIGATQNVTVQRVTLGNQTQMECSDTNVPVVAGTVSVCTIDAFDSMGQPVREEAFSAAFQPTIVNQGLELKSSVDFDAATGKYLVRYTPTSSGSCTVRIAYAASLSRHWWGREILFQVRIWYTSRHWRKVGQWWN